MHRAAAALLLALLVAGCGGSSGTGSSSSTKVVTAQPPKGGAAAVEVLGAAGRYVDARVAAGRMPRVHVGRVGVIGKVGLVYLVGGSDVGKGTAPNGLWGVLVLAERGGAWHVTPPAIQLRAHS